MKKLLVVIVGLMLYLGIASNCYAKDSEVIDYLSNKRVTLYEDSNVAVILTKAGEEHILGYLWRVCLINKTAGTDIRVAISNPVINGVASDTLWCKVVSGNSELNDAILWGNSFFSENNITQVDLIDFDLTISNASTMKNISSKHYSIYFNKNHNVSINDIVLTAESVVIADTDTLFFAIVGTKVDPYWGYIVDAYVENRTDYDTMVVWEKVSANGYMVDPAFSVCLPAHTKRVCRADWFLQDFYRIGFNENDITGIEFTLKQIDTNRWSTNFYEGKGFYYPKGTDNFKEFAREPRRSDVVLASTNEVTVIATNRYLDDYKTYRVDFLLHNKSDEDLVFCVTDSYINGRNTNKMWEWEVPAGKYKVVSAGWTKTFFEDNDFKIGVVGELKLVFEVMSSTKQSILNNIFVINP